MAVPLRAVALLLPATFLRAQQEVVIHSRAYTPPSAILRSETTLVEADLTVRDSQGRTITNLHASDFQVFDNGRPQVITAFSELRSDGKSATPEPSATAENIPPADIPPPAPKYITFFFDDSHLSSPAMLFVRRAAHAFIEKGLKPTDWTSIVTISSVGDLDFTNDAKLFADKLDHLQSHVRPEIPAKCGVGATDSFIVLQNLDYPTIERAIDAATPCACGGAETPMQCRAKATPLARQLAETMWEQTQAESINTISALGFAAKKLSEVNGTRILVLTSSGFLIPAGEPAMEKFVDGAVHWNIVVHALDAGGLQASTQGLLRQSLFWTPMEKVTDGTGGHFFKNTNDLAGAMDLAANPEVTYLLAFNPGPRDGKFHTLKIQFKSKRPESVQFRPGYFSPRDDQKTSSRAAMDAAVFSKDTLRELPAAVSVKPGDKSVSVTVAIDVGGLQFVVNNGRHVQQLVFLMTLLDSNGAFITGKEAIMDLALTDEKLASLQEEGLKAVATLNAPAGTYQLRAIVREGMKGALAASTLPVDLHSN
jgi:VWFA-related protein